MPTTPASRRERGMATAELMTVAPFGVMLVLLLLWVVSLGLAEVRVTDSAREAARLVARGETIDTATRAARQGVPPDTEVQVVVDDGVVTVRVRTRSQMPLPFFSGIGAQDVGADASAVLEAP